jgi:hypothetical protein
MMTQLEQGLNLSIKRTRKREFLDETTRVVPWQKLIALSERTPQRTSAADDMWATFGRRREHASE